MKHTSEAKLKELTSQQSKQVVALEAAEKETVLLKEEVKALKVICNKHVEIIICKYFMFYNHLESEITASSINILIYYCSRHIIFLLYVIYCTVYKQCVNVTRLIVDTM